MRFTFIAAKKAEHTVSILCRCLRVTRSGFYAWQRRPESTHARDDRRLKVLVQASFEESKQRYGSPRIHEDLIEQDEHVSRKRVVRLMQEDGLEARARKRYKITTMSDHDQPVAANLLDRQFEAEAPNQRWVSDTTEFVIGSSGKLSRGRLGSVLAVYRGVGRQRRERSAFDDRRPGGRAHAAVSRDGPAPSL